ncbi:MAG: hypothetical protein IKH04_00595 [Kiritimatiellae bacterium]|nr:hypothetical protein [Kiritimatiellia bacterium]
MREARRGRLRLAVVAVLLSAATVAHGGLSVELDSSGVSWICGEDGGRIIGVGALRVKQKGWRGSVSVTQEEDCVVAVFTAAGGEGRPHGWTVPTPLGKGARKEPFPIKAGRWRRHPAGREAEPVEVSLGKWKVVRSPHGNLIFSLGGNENWCGDRHESVEFVDGAEGVLSRRIAFHEMREEETPEECVARMAGLPFRPSLGCPVRNNIFDGGGAALDVAVAETAGRRVSGAPVSLTVRDWDGNAIFADRRPADIQPHGRFGGRVAVPTPGRGVYFVELAVGEGEEEEFTRTTFAVVPPFRFSPDDTFFGLCLRTGRTFHDEREEEYALAARLGFRYLRGGDDALARRFGMRAGFSRQMPRHDYGAEAGDAAEVEGWLDEIARMGSPLFEFGNEVGHFEDEAERHVLYDRYGGWLDAIRAARARRGMSFQIAYGTSSRRPELMRLIEDKGIFRKLDMFVVHPGRLNWTPDLVGPGWRYRGLILGSKKIYDDFGHASTPIILTEVYTKTQPHSPHSDSLRQSAESAVLNAVIAKADGMAGFCAFQLHEGTSFDENGIAPKDSRMPVQWHYGIMNRDNSPKPSAVAYETAAEELEGARFDREVRLAGTNLRGFVFDTPRGPLAVLWDRTEGYDLRTQGPRRRDKGEPFFHFEPWLDNWRVRTDYVFKVADGARGVTVRDAIGRESEIPAAGGRVALALTGAPVFVRGLDPAQFDDATSHSPEIPETSDEAEVHDDG